MAGLLYPAYQKYYSAIGNLKRFRIENNFFDNISSLDNFFSEYRSVTLVMQKSLAHTPYIEAYNRISDGIWDSFFNDQRVKAVHMHPVEFTKKIDITVYSPNIGVTISSQSVTVENDIPLNSVVDSLKDFFHTLNTIEVFFSAKFSFIEKDTGIDLWDKLIEGLDTMQKFMDAMYLEIGETCPLCDKLRSEINLEWISEKTKDLLLVADYAYYPHREEFERAGRIATLLKTRDGSTADRLPLDMFMSHPYLNDEKSAFNKFVLMHAIIGSSDLMPTIMTIYQDDTYEIETFHADIKTTMYRKINETAEKISCNDVREVFVMLTYVSIDYKDDLNNLTSKERLSEANNEYLVFMKVDCELNEEEYVFDGRYIRQIEYIAHIIKNGKQNKFNFGAVNMIPIIEAFKICKNSGEIDLLVSINNRNIR